MGNLEGVLIRNADHQRPVTVAQETLKQMESHSQVAANGKWR